MSNKMKFDQKMLTFKLRQAGDAQRNILNALPGVHWLVAALFAVMFGVSAFAMVKTKLVFGEMRTVSSAKPTASYKLNKTPLAPAEYKNVLDWYTRLHPDVQFELPKEGGLQVSVKDGGKHSDWLYALASLQARDADVIWEAESFCVGRCTGGSAVSVVRGYRQKMVQE